jgi:AcrR family transcriptional regulator
MARPQLSPEEIERFRHRLCSMAMERIAEHGYEGLSLRGLTKALGCSYATPYRYFRDKQHIFAAVRALAYEQFASALDEGAMENGDAERRLHALMQAYVRFARQTPHAYKLICELGLPGPDEHPEYWPKERRTWEIWAGEVEHAIDSGLIAGDPIQIAHVFWASVHGAVSLHLGRKLVLGLDLDTLVSSITDALLLAYQPRRFPQ